MGRESARKAQYPEALVQVLCHRGLPEAAPLARLLLRMRLFRRRAGFRRPGLGFS